MDLRTAINEVLLSINELPLTENDNIDDIQSAIIVNKELNIAKRTVLSNGWKFNTINISLQPNSNGYILVPNTVLALFPLNNTLIVRDWKLYNTIDSSFIFTEPQIVKMYQDVSFDDLPFHIVNLIIKKASLSSYIHIVGSGDDLSQKRIDIQEANIIAVKTEARARNGNVLDDSYVTNLMSKAY